MLRGKSGLKRVLLPSKHRSSLIINYLHTFLRIFYFFNPIAKLQTTYTQRNTDFKITLHQLIKQNIKIIDNNFN
jgi:hypothetical protein